ncbi:T9SS type A sorting domain-containing protein [Aquimarina agarivorans]|uniref:T9SS type A sorting domain-containing protein n=1 Tax=Aquimarina agarivorans TaxID=980584 RepID=UPI000248EB58|nr:T9SS type A sorting domain-containing protein [Aquimarina agarivorans]
MKLKMSIGICALFCAYIFAQPSPPSGKKWVKVNELSDEFSGGQINSQKWFDYHPFWKGRLPSQFKKGNATQSGGFLRLKSTLFRNPNSVNNKFKDHWVDAAAVVSKNKSATPGYYYECRMKASNLSMTSSFWFRVGAFSEIDVIEHIGNPANRNVASKEFQYDANTHYYGKFAGIRPLDAKWTMPFRGRDRFHNFGFWWKSPNELLFYYNGNQVMKIVPRRPFDEKLHMIFDTEVFPFETAGVANIGLPRVNHLNDNSKNTMLVDWVRVYKLENGTPSNSGGSTGVGGAPINKVISLRKTGGNRGYVAAEAANNRLIANRSRIGSWERFRVESHPRGGIALKALVNNKYVQVPNTDIQASVRPNGNGKFAWERFEWESRGNGKVAFKSVHTGRYLQAAWTEDNGVIRARGGSAKGWETFDWKELSGAKVLDDLSVNEALIAYPNPVTSFIELKGTHSVDAQISDINGKLIPVRITPSKETNSIFVEFDTSVSSGVYFVKTASGKTIRFVKK